MATRPRTKIDDIFSRLDTIPACDGQTAIFRQQVRAMHICVAHNNTKSGPNNQPKMHSKTYAKRDRA